MKPTRSPSRVRPKRTRRRHRFQRRNPKHPFNPEGLSPPFLNHACNWLAGYSRASSRQVCAAYPRERRGYQEQKSAQGNGPHLRVTPKTVKPQYAVNCKGAARHHHKEVLRQCLATAQPNYPSAQPCDCYHLLKCSEDPNRPPIKRD